MKNLRITQGFAGTGAAGPLSYLGRCFRNSLPRSPPMAIRPTPDLFQALRVACLLSDGQVDTLTRELVPRFTDPRALARELVRRNWVTPYQINQLFLGRERDLNLGPYLLLERLGEGGMGQVFK